MCFSPTLTTPCDSPPRKTLSSPTRAAYAFIGKCGRIATENQMAGWGNLRLTPSFPILEMYVHVGLQYTAIIFLHLSTNVNPHICKPTHMSVFSKTRYLIYSNSSRVCGKEGEKQELMILPILSTLICRSCRDIRSREMHIPQAPSSSLQKMSLHIRFIIFHINTYTNYTIAIFPGWNKLFNNHTWLAGGWTNPSEKYARRIGSFPQFSGWK